MPIIASNFDKFVAEKKKTLEAPIKVDSGVKIIDIKKEELNVGGTAEAVLKIDYDFTVKYDPKQAEIVIEGHLLYAESTKKVEEILKNWKKTQKFDPEVAQLIMNNILIKCNIKALLLSQEIGLPPHIRLPMVQKGSPKKSAPAKSPKADYTG